MRNMRSFVTAGIVMAMAVPALGQMQMMNPAYGMGGSRRTMINLISPADSPTQIARGTLVIGATSRRNGSANYLSLILRLVRVTDNDGALVTSPDNQLQIEGRIQFGSGATEQERKVDEAFPITAGNAYVRVLVPLGAIDDQATLAIDKVAVVDKDGGEFAVPGVVIASPPTAPPGTTPGAPCTQQSDCDDGDPNTWEVCTLFGCQQMPMHAGPGITPTPGFGPGTGMKPGSHMGGPMM